MTQIELFGRWDRCTLCGSFIGLVGRPIGLVCTGCRETRGEYDPELDDATLNVAVTLSNEEQIWKLEQLYMKSAEEEEL